VSRTPLYDFHVSHGGQMVPFGGFYMPVQYAGLSISKSHAFTREQSSIFDVSHMAQRIFTGPGAAAFLERVTPGGVNALEPHRSTLSCLLHADGSGGIVDDTIITRLTDAVFYVVTNAGCRDKDNAYLDAEISKWNAESDHAELQVFQEQLDGWGLVALQGPAAQAVLGQTLGDSSGVNLDTLYFGHSVYVQAKLPGMKSSKPLLVSRGGYTGEDGFEISIPPEDTVTFTEALLAAGGKEKVQLAGLGARDSLRLEAGMCLYGHDLDDSTTPVEAGLSWIIPKDRRTADAGFYGANVIAKQLVPRSKGGSGVQRRRVGLVVEGAPAREGVEIVSRPEDGGAPITLGVVTSGCPSPTLGQNIAMGYIKDGFHNAGTEVTVLVRGRPRKAVVTKMPFVPSKYWKGP
jgi:aminomethyltransferase